MYKLRRRILSQNFIYNRKLIQKLIRRSSIGSFDTILEIGPGKGFITSELLKIATKVIAVEIDSKLTLHLKKFLGNNSKLDLYLANFLDFSLSKTEYKVFANIPFSIEGKIVRKLLEDKNPPKDCYLIVRKDLAERLSGFYFNNQFSIKNKPFFDFTICHQFYSADFIPRTNINCVMWRITKRKYPLIPYEFKKDYQKFIELSFGQGLPVNQNLKKILSSDQLKFLTQNINFSLRAKPSSLSLDQWLKIYKLTHSLINKNN